MVRECDSLIELYRKPILIFAHIMPGLTGFRLTETVNDYNPVQKKTFSIGGGIGMEYTFLRKNRSLFGVGIALDYNTYKIMYTLDLVNDTLKNQIDVDGDKYHLYSRLTYLEEKSSITFFEIPVYLTYSYWFSGNFAIFLKTGIKVGFTISKKYNSTGDGEYKGQYPSYNNIILYGNELSEWGFGTYDLEYNGTNENLKGLNFSAFGGAGISFKFSERIKLDIGAYYTKGFSNLSQTNEGMILSKNKDNIKSLTAFGKAKTQEFYLDVGIDFDLSK
jgi:hypothetical protein